MAWNLELSNSLLCLIETKFSETVFQGEADFGETRFEGVGYFTKTEFNERTDFDDTLFQNGEKIP